jgi:hypothetical protein
MLLTVPAGTGRACNSTPAPWRAYSGGRAAGIGIERLVATFGFG